MKHLQRVGAVAAVGALAFTLGAPAFAIADPVASAPAALAAVSASQQEAVIDDSSYDLDDCFAGNYYKVNDAATIKINTSWIATGNATVPTSTNLLVGWKKNFFDGDQEAVRELGNIKQTGHSLTFAAGSTCEVRSLKLQLNKDKLVIPAGASITFKNCTFANRIVIEKGGSATFENCTFTSGTIMNNGTASYTGTTKEPKNDGKAQSAFESLALVPAITSLDDAYNGGAYSKTVDLAVSGTNKDQVKLSAKVAGDTGLVAKVQDGKLVISGTPTAAGSATITVTATAPGEAEGSTETVKATVTVNVAERLSVSLEGTLDCVTKGQKQYYNSLKVKVAGEDGQARDYYDWSVDGHDGSTISASISPAGSGMTVNAFASAAGTSVTVGGDAERAGTYQVTVTVSYKGQTVTSEPVDLRIYTGEETLAGQIAALEGEPSTWDMEPYEVWKSGGAVIPTWLHGIYGSHKSGLYGQIGNAKDAWASDTLTIPAGADVEIANMKINSSVKVIVEKGAKLTLTDSVVFGELEVNGGELVVTPAKKNDAGTYEIGNSAINGVLTFNDGSTLRDSSVISNADFLTDGRYAGVPEQAVVVNGTVTFEGQNYIESSEGQTGLLVNGTAKIPAGSKLTVVSSEVSTAAEAGGVAVKLGGGSVKGEGTLVVRGGNGTLGAAGGKAVAGTGTIETAGFEAQGGTSDGMFGKVNAGADAGERGVVLFEKLAGNYKIAGGAGVNDAADGLGIDSFTVKKAGSDTDGGDKKPSQPGGDGAGKGDSGKRDGDKKSSDFKKGKKGKKGVLPQTGDASFAAAAAAGMGVMALSGAVVMRARRKRD